MGYVEGHVLHDVNIALEALPDRADRLACGHSFIDVLADLHAVDVDAVGLGDLARKEGYIARQLKRWYSQFEESTKTTGRPVPLVHDLHEKLSAAIPPQGPATIVHGDYRLDNTMLADDGTVKAVLDWEICTLGDPLADVGLLMVYWAEPTDQHTALGEAPTTAPGFHTRAELAARYGERSGRDVSSIDFYVAFGYWKLACILEGVFARYLGGAGGGDRTGLEGFSRQVELLAEAADQAAAGL
jgi:aminoglycoside phosphotransferase (APT) family kinase protein